MRHLGVVSLAVALAACGGGDDESALVGIWEVSSWSENPTACDSPGETVDGPRGQPYLAVLDQKFFGQRYLTALECLDLEECRELLAETETLHLGSYTFERGSDADGWTGTTAFVFTGDDGDCAGEVLAHTMREDDGGALVIDTVRTEVSGFPPDADGFCDADEAEEVAADLPCAGREQLISTRVE